MNHFVPPAARFTTRPESNFFPGTDALRNFLIIFQSLVSESATVEFQLYRKAIGRLKFFCITSFLLFLPAASSLFPLAVQLVGMKRI
jgi:hypothetical protein